MTRADIIKAVSEKSGVSEKRISCDTRIADVAICLTAATESPESIKDKMRLEKWVSEAWTEGDYVNLTVQDDFLVTELLNDYGKAEFAITIKDRLPNPREYTAIRAHMLSIKHRDEKSCKLNKCLHEIIWRLLTLPDDIGGTRHSLDIIARLWSDYERDTHITQGAIYGAIAEILAAKCE